jgi:asparagine synthase (glutamine-hydrolysing)
MKGMVAVYDKTGEKATDLLLEYYKNLESEYSSFGISTNKEQLIGSYKEIKRQRIVGQLAVGFYSSNSLDPNQQPFLKVNQHTTLAFQGTIYTKTRDKSSKEYTSQKLAPGANNFEENFLNETEGDYALFIIKAQEMKAGRDPIGVKPLYFGENESKIALATTRKSLWQLGIETPKSFPPGNLATIEKTGIRFKPIKVIEMKNPKTISMSKASDTLRKLLENSVHLRIFGEKRIAVAFSGGLDSTIIAFLARKLGADVQLIHVSLKDQPETEEAKEAAEKIGIPLKTCLFTESDLEKVVSKVVGLVEEPDPIKISIGVPFYWTSLEALASGHKVILAGQGADELFGGYQRYVKEYLQSGDQAVRKTMFFDVSNIHESNIERDEKICEYLDVELRLPFASYSVVEFATELPTDLKFDKDLNSLRKLVLRQVARELGIPVNLADKPKRAVQYSTGVNNAIKRLAKRRNLTTSQYIHNLFIEQKQKLTEQGVGI